MTEEKPLGYDIPPGQTIAGIGGVFGRLNAVNPGAKIEPGSYNLATGVSAVGTLTVTNGLTVSNGGAYVVDLRSLNDDSAPGDGQNWDKIAVTGGATLFDKSGFVTVNFINSTHAPDSGAPFWDSPKEWTILTASAPVAGRLSVSNKYWPNGLFITQPEGNALKLKWMKSSTLLFLK